MEHLRININDSDLFDRYIQESRSAQIPDHGDLTVVTKRNATENGRSAAMITFHVDVGGETHRVQTVTTAANLAALAHVMDQICEDDRRRGGLTKEQAE